MCDVDHGMMILTEANSQLVYHSALVAPVLAGGPVSRDISGSHQYCPAALPSEISLERVGEWAKEMRI
jgi:hypothetical protein